MVQWVIIDRYNKGLNVIQVECEPCTSIPFWEKNGFTIYEVDDGRYSKKYGYKVLERQLYVPEGRKLLFSIKWYSSRINHDCTVAPFKIYQVEGVIANSGEVLLTQRIIGFYPNEGNEESKDIVISISTGEKIILHAHAKSSEAKEQGIIKQGINYIYYFDKIIVPSSLVI